MVDPALRIRLEGKVEELEGALRTWANALGAARRKQFGLAALMLDRRIVSLDPHGDDELSRLLGRQTALRREVEALVAARLQLLGMPSEDLARGARWLTTEPVLYEHDRLNPSSTFLSLVVSWQLTGLLLALSHSWLSPLLGLAIFLGAIRLFDRSRVVLTRRRLILEGRVIDLTNTESLQLVRPYMTFGPQKFDVEIRSKSGELTFGHLRYAPVALRHRLISLGIDTGSEWGRS